MTNSEEAIKEADFKAGMIRRHAFAFALWHRCHEMLEDSVVRERDLSEPFARALDILFVQAFKSHGSMYVLCVIGQGEDAATIARRMLEILFQAAYLCADEGQRDDRAKRYLAWFWTQAEDRIRAGLSAADAKRWQADYDAHKHLLVNSKGKRLRNWWGNSSIRDMATKAGLGKRYDSDYRYLSQASHCTARGIMVQTRGRTTEIRTTGFEIRPLLVYSTSYVLSIAQLWNARFGLIEEKGMQEVSCQVMEFDWKAEVEA